MYNISDNEFKELRDYMYEKTGVYLKDTKKNLVKSRLSKRIKELNLSSFKDYLKLIRSSKKEAEVFINFITTNETYFFREREHLEFLVKTIKDNRISNISIWSAACSSGEEPYSTAIYLKENCPGLKFSILATDINTQMLDTAKKGIYNHFRLRATPDEWKEKYFKMIEKKGNYVIYQLDLKKISGVNFKYHNLLKSQYNKFDIIFLRNVLIYFDKESKKRVFMNMKKSLKSSGYLILGKSESMMDLYDEFKFISSSVYKYEE